MVLTTDRMGHLAPLVRKLAARLTNESAQFNYSGGRKVSKSAAALVQALAVLQLTFADTPADVSIASRRYVTSCTTIAAYSLRALVMVMVADGTTDATYVVGGRDVVAAPHC